MKKFSSLIGTIVLSILLLITNVFSVCAATNVRGLSGINAYLQKQGAKQYNINYSVGNQIAYCFNKNHKSPSGASYQEATSSPTQNDYENIGNINVDSPISYDELIPWVLYYGYSGDENLYNGSLYENACNLLKESPDFKNMPDIAIEFFAKDLLRAATQYVIWSLGNGKTEIPETGYDPIAVKLAKMILDEAENADGNPPVVGAIYKPVLNEDWNLNKTHLNQNLIVPQNVVVTNEKEILISKTNLNGEEIKDAEIEIYDLDGNKLFSWTSEEGKTKSIKLQPGTYVFHENTAPAGYQLVNDITFTVGEYGTITKFSTTDLDCVSVNSNKMTVIDKDEPDDDFNAKSYVVKKLDQYNSFVVGAKLRITKVGSKTASPSNAAGTTTSTRLNGNILNIVIRNISDDFSLKNILEWTTENEPYTFELSEGNYTLEEINAPLGYEKASAINFSIDANGNLLVNNEIVSELVMIDKKIALNSTTTVDSNHQEAVEDDSNNPTNSTEITPSNSGSSSSSGSSSNSGSSSSSGSSSNSGSSSSSNSSSEKSDVNSTILETKETPLENSLEKKQDAFDISNEDISLGTIPKTSDTTNDFIWILLGLSSTIGLAAFYITGRKKIN